ncbi:flagellar motor protein MotB [Planctomycetota bacterium]
MKKKQEAQGPKVPGYIVTFSDMVTLLLTFFVMLLSLANVQDPELFDKGRDSFIDSLRYAGLGMLWGKKQTPDLGNMKIKYFISDPEDTSDNRTLDAKAEQLRRIYEQITQSAQTVSRQSSEESINFSVANIHFPPGQAEIDEESIKFLSEFCDNLKQSFGLETGKLYVLGLADEEKTEKDKWLLSARRAETVADYLRNNLGTAGRDNNSGSSSNWSIYSWGTGSGGDWAGQNSPMSKTSQILIAVLR